MTLLGAGGEGLKRLGKGTADAVSALKNILKSIGAFAKYAGPIAGAVCSILSAFLEPGPADIINALQAGFQQMHTRFDIIESKLSELGPMMEVANEKQSYKKDVRDWVQKMNLNRGHYLANQCDRTPINEVRSLCIAPSDENSPHDLMLIIHNYFKSPDGFAHLLFGTVKYDINELRKNFVRIVGDASELTNFYMAICLPFLTQNSLAYQAKTSTMNAYWLSDIINDVNKFDNQVLYDWPTYMEMGVLGLLNRATESTEPQGLADEIYNTLAPKYWWNEFNIIVFKNSDPSSGHQFRIIHPGYSRHVQIVGKWDAVIDWRLKDETEADAETKTARSDRLAAAKAKMDQILTFDRKESYCKDTSGKPYVPTSEEYRGANVKTLFIRKDLESDTWKNYDKDNIGRSPLQNPSSNIHYIPYVRN